MIETTFQGDTLLKQLDKAVDLKSVQKINLQRKLIEPSHIRKVDSISRNDSTKKAEQQIVKPIIQYPPPARNQAQKRVEIQTNSDSIKKIEPTPVLVTVEEVAQPEIILPEKVISKGYPDWSIGIFILSFIIFASVRLFFNKYLAQLFNGALNYPTAFRLFRERSLNIMHGSFRLEVLFYIILSYFFFQTGNEFGYEFTQPSFISYLIIFGSVIAYFVGKRFLYFIIGFFTDSIPSTQEYLFNFNQYLRILGLFLLPISLIINFASLQNSKILFFTGFGFALLAYLLALLRGSRILLTKHFSISYLILYLCTLEILPLVFIYKLMLVY